MAMVDRFDVVAVEIATGKVTEMLGEGKSERSAEGIVMMAVARRGCDEHFYADVPTGKFKVGDQYKAEGEDA